jgi:hypothetical protein
MTVATGRLSRGKPERLLLGCSRFPSDLAGIALLGITCTAYAVVALSR